MIDEFPRAKLAIVISDKNIFFYKRGIYLMIGRYVFSPQILVLLR